METDNSCLLWKIFWVTLWHDLKSWGFIRLSEMLIYCPTLYIHSSIPSTRILQSQRVIIGWYFCLCRFSTNVSYIVMLRLNKEQSEWVRTGTIWETGAVYEQRKSFRTIIRHPRLYILRIWPTLRIRLQLDKGSDLSLTYQITPTNIGSSPIMCTHRVSSRGA